ncbi:LLM class flavin-dependent oxidoreductase [Streptomyces sp. NPDC059568]|uniref:LLM class flavin-dependent oxidoreductase n=1 Tax=Streptomyces sp. NPDC059568 TaxID=3346868 RepID=UPI0036CDBFC2
MNVGRVGIWSVELRLGDPGEISERAAELDELGWGALWIPGLGGGDIIGDSERLLRATRILTVATGILSIWRHDAEETAAGHHRLQQTYNRRLITGLGVSDPAAAQQAGRPFRPVADMNDYLDQLDASTTPLPAGERVLAALGRVSEVPSASRRLARTLAALSESPEYVQYTGDPPPCDRTHRTPRGPPCGRTTLLLEHALGPRLLDLAARRTAGTHTFLVTPESTASTRQLLGPAAALVPYQAVVLDTNPDTARATARGFLGPFIGMAHYARSLRRQGFTDTDLADGGSDHLIDSVVAWGDTEAIARRVQAHHNAGADHVALHVLTANGGFPRTQWRELAPLAQ